MKIKLYSLFFLTLISFGAHASGGITHMYIAKESINKITDPLLRQVLNNHLDAYLVGAYYPDSGYIQGASYGEISHWDPFINAFKDYLKTHYRHPLKENPKLAAFLFGCAAHRVTDEIMHWTFYPIVAEHDFKNDTKKAHNACDMGIDLLLTVDYNLWGISPRQWWVPVNDLIAVYKQMGKTVTANEINWGNQIISMAGDSERLIASASYPFLTWQMPWTVKHYYYFVPGGILHNIDQVAIYQMTLLKHLQSANLGN